MTWLSPVPDPVDGPMAGAERPILEGMLAHQRRTLLNICADLTAEQLALRPLATSNLSLLGLVRHMAKVERIWLRKRVAGEDVEHLHNFEARDDTDFNQIDAADAPVAVEQLRDESALADRAVAFTDLDHTVDVHGHDMSLRMIYIHLVQEYARHNGHADLLREAIDGATGR
ncbi:DinB family protein [Aeromicrobium endophyticum]|uniref:DinB family protein n=1 Tax=Aeromicrobium endophyticum TaxID=2292704 RepID=A0A371P857_9ACTN|nr:DinB family protein [Aeromicrobium endophyticum]REK72143.1 DinB family protein [Aeromicrobium endophyticum]